MLHQKNSFSFLLFLIVGMIVLLGCPNTNTFPKENHEFLSPDPLITSPQRSRNSRSETLKRQSAIARNHRQKPFGIDVSHYQGQINWHKVKTVPGNQPIRFVMMRASMGIDGKDRYFRHNWQQTKGKFIRGAYHYYRPNENSLKQANNFIRTVRLQRGDLPPILDIEGISDIQSMKRLKLGLQRWLNAVEQHYKVRPIIYTGHGYFQSFLEKEFSGYPLWIAHYSKYAPMKHWAFWQYSHSGRVTGIQGNVDLNVFNGSLSQLRQLTKK